MIPLRHTLPLRTTPFVNRALVMVNILIFLTLLVVGERAEVVIRTLGFIPARLLNPAAFGFNHFEAAITLVTSLFLHGGLVHLFGNMIYLWVFGGPIEDTLGHVRYLLFFIAGGIVGSITHTILFPPSSIPSIGASGCIAAVLGAFLILRPRARIVTLSPLVIYWAMAEIRAVIFLPIWFAMQFFNGFLAVAAAPHVADAGIAWWAHVGGFLFGAAVGAGLRMSRRGSTRGTT
jgi:membrane associated rhomboid family serine protease